jgi:quercetin dioxygenase-like cupin family protein
MTKSIEIASTETQCGDHGDRPAMRMAFALLALFVVLSAPPSVAQGLPPTEIGSARPESVEFKQFAAFPAGAELAIIVGKPAEPGPYAVRVKVPGGVKLMPHIHPEDRIYVVISGVFYIGFGTRFDAEKLMAYAPGSVVVLPRNTPHFHQAQSGEYITQVTGTGPLGIDYIDKEDDPRNHRARAAASTP